MIPGDRRAAKSPGNDAVRPAIHCLPDNHRVSPYMLTIAQFRRYNLLENTRGGIP